MVDEAVHFWHYSMERSHFRGIMSLLTNFLQTIICEYSQSSNKEMTSLEKMGVRPESEVKSWAHG